MSLRLDTARDNPVDRRRIAASVVLLAAALLAGIAGVAAAMEAWAIFVLVCAGAVWVVVAYLADPLVAGLGVVTAALPIYNVGWISSIGRGVGLLTVFVGLLFILAVARKPRCFAAAVRDPRIVLLALFSLTFFVSALRAVDRATALSLAKTEFGRGLVLPLIFMIVFYPLAFTAGLRLAVILRNCVIAVALAGTLLAIVQIASGRAYLGAGGVESPLAQFVGKRAVGLSEHPGTWAAFLLIAVAFVGARWIKRGDLPSAALMLLFTLGVIVTGLRSGWLALLAMLLLGAVGAATHRIRIAAVGLVLTAVVVALLFGNFRTFLGGGNPADSPLALAEGRLDLDESARTRIILTRAEVDLGLQNPLTGVGPGGIGLALGSLDAQYLADQELVRPGEPIETHNTYTGLFAELGVPGIVMFLAILGTGFRALWQARHLARDPELQAVVQGLFAALAGTAVVAAFTDADRQIFLWWILGFAFAVERSLRGSRARS